MNIYAVYIGESDFFVLLTYDLSIKKTYVLSKLERLLMFDKT